MASCTWLFSTITVSVVRLRIISLLFQHATAVCPLGCGLGPELWGIRRGTAAMMGGTAAMMGGIAAMVASAADEFDPWKRSRPRMPAACAHRAVMASPDPRSCCQPLSQAGR